MKIRYTMRDSLAGLAVLMAVADKRSFTGAAAELRVTPSAVSQTIRALENRVGVRLLQRTTRHVGLTEAGVRFVERLRPALEGVRGAFESLGELRDRPAGVLRLQMPRMAFTHLVRPHLASFLQEHPDVSLEVFVSDRASGLIEEGFDAGIHLGETIGRDMVAVRLSEDQRMAVVGSASYFKANGKPKHPRELQRHGCINYRQEPGAPVYRWEFTENGRDFEVAVDGRLLVNDRELMLLAALEGVGLAYVAESRAREHLDGRRLVRVLDAWCPAFPGLFLYYPSRAHLAPKLQALVDFFKRRRRTARP